MFEAYRIGITVALTGQVTSILAQWSRNFAATNAEAMALQRTLAGIKTLAMTGMVMGGLGYAGVRMFGDIIKPAKEYAHQLNILNMAGMDQKDIAEAVAAAWKNTSDVMTTTATGNLKTLLDLRNILVDVNKEGGNVGKIDMSMALTELPIVSRIQAVMASSSEEGVRRTASDNFAFSMAKALDIIGAASTPQKFEEWASGMAKVITAFQGRVTPQMFQSVFAYARQAKFGLSQEFAEEFLPTLMLEYAQGAHSQGGGSRGVGPALGAFSRLTLQGYINKKAMPELTALGLINPGSALQTTTQGTTIGPMVGADIARSNPFEWVQRILMPAIEKRFGGNATRDQIIQEIMSITRGNQLASQLIMEFALKSPNFLRDQAIIRGAMPYDRAFVAAMQNDPDFAYSALSAQWENLKTALGISVIPVLVPALMKLTGALNDFARWAKDNQWIVEPLMWSFLGLSASLLFSGVVLTLAAAFRALALVFTLGGLAPTLIRGVAGGLGLMGGSLGTIAAAGGAVTVLAGVAAALGVLASGDVAQRIEEWVMKKLGVTTMPDGYTWQNSVGGLQLPIPYWNKDKGKSDASPKGDKSSWLDWLNPFGSASAATPSTVAPAMANIARSGSDPIGIRSNNPGNLMPGGHEAVFATPLDGLRAMANNLHKYGLKGWDTISAIISHWAPASDPRNNVPAYIADVAKRSGFGPNQKLNLDDPKVLAQLMPAMVHHEQGKDPYGPLYPLMFGTKETAAKPATTSTTGEPSWISSLVQAVTNGVKDGLHGVRVIMDGDGHGHMDTKSNRKPPDSASMVDPRLGPMYPALP